jgi:hypothetical protein
MYQHVMCKVYGTRVLFLGLGSESHFFVEKVLNFCSKMQMTVELGTYSVIP